MQAVLEKMGLNEGLCLQIKEENASERQNVVYKKKIILLQEILFVLKE